MAQRGTMAIVGVVGVCLMAVLPACSSKKELSAAAFDAIINATLKDSKECMGFKVMSQGDIQALLPGLMPAVASQARSGLATNKVRIIQRRIDNGNAAEQALFQTLKSYNFIYGDLYTWRGLGFFAPRVEVAILNERALPYYIESKRSDGVEIHTQGNLCYADLRVGKIIRWSEPAEHSGYKVTSVEYTVEPINVADWAKNLVKFFDTKPKSRQLVLTNDGWSADLSIIR